MHHHDMGRAHDTRDWRDVADEIVIELIVQCRVDSVDGTGHEQRVAVSKCVHDRLGADIASRTRPVFDEEGLGKAFGEPLTHHARERSARSPASLRSAPPGPNRRDAERSVGRAAGRPRNDHAYRPPRIGLRPNDARDGGQRGSTRCQMQKLPSVGKFHGALPKQPEPDLAVVFHAVLVSVKTIASPES
jgi:hypothetical protein